MIKVWDLYIRSYHWLLVIILVSNLFLNEEGEAWHQNLGLSASLLVLIRILWGFVCPTPYARWKFFWPTRRRLRTYGAALFRRDPPRLLSHNPLAASVMLVMLALVLGLGFTGWLQGTEAFHDYQPLEKAHATLSTSLLILIAMHVLGIFVESWHTKENLVASMIHGKKRPSSG